MNLELMGNSLSKSFGKRLALLRKKQNLTQKELGEKVGVSLRVVSYYENESEYPPIHILPKLAKVLKISLDELFDIKAFKPLKSSQESQLIKKLKKAENLSPKDQKALLYFLNILLKKAD